MAARKQVNLLPQDDFESSTTGKFVKWAVNVGRWIVVLTEFVVICAFLSRFYFDTELANLFDEIKQKQAIVESASSFEDNFRLVQNRTKQVKNILAQQSPTSPLFSEVTSLIPLGITLDGMSFTENFLNLSGTALSENDLRVFLSGLTNHPKFTDVTLTNVSSEKNIAMGVTFTISAVVKK